MQDHMICRTCNQIVLVPADCAVIAEALDQYISYYLHDVANEVDWDEGADDWAEGSEGERAQNLYGHMTKGDGA